MNTFNIVRESGYQGCTWYLATIAGKRVKVVYRRSLDTYERSTLNGGALGDYAKLVAGLVGCVYLENSYKAEPLPLEFLAAFNAYLLDNHRASITEMDAKPERYGLELSDPIRVPPAPARAIAHFHYNGEGNGHYTFDY